MFRDALNIMTPHYKLKFLTKTSGNFNSLPKLDNLKVSQKCEPDLESDFFKFEVTVEFIGLSNY